MNLQEYKAVFLDFLQKKIRVKQPENLYLPVDYILQLGGKRIRPLLTLLSTEAFGGNYRDALDAALSVEMFHNFTLLHDDIMDEAFIRRGKTTVHKKWNINTGILSGDVMLINAYQHLEKYDASIFKDLILLFSKTAQEVCEGQQYDMDFETRSDVRIDEYMEMIRLKTSVLLAAALEMGAIIAGASNSDRKKIYDFGIQMGMAFQLQDDYLDSFGNTHNFGKKIGGDILENKKTWLYLTAYKKASQIDKEKLFLLYNSQPKDAPTKIQKVQEFFKHYHVDILIQKEIESYSKQALDTLSSMKLIEETKNVLTDLIYKLSTRQS